MFFPIKYIVVNLNSNRVIETVRFITTFPELRASKNVCIIGRNALLLKLLMGYVKNLIKQKQNKIKTALKPSYTLRHRVFYLGSLPLAAAS